MSFAKNYHLELFPAVYLLLKEKGKFSMGVKNSCTDHGKNSMRSCLQNLQAKRHDGTTGCKCGAEQ